ncbi:hypothetical protein A3D00_02125 [Candidatus Woesebacteria bacterium RIFCSPHIGHO2_02_FULL_38_9]|nr:MAG: hypothetical protein A3D00_02125 [Candidatus Woesebacteria bacterium RIFCSPHIGHO2_02_FULL_38_9]OGM57823.1 MAG: hypothetical protein A3A50_02305 [Candidatus Woesebacteria bacterium RIFCSPLOWO2_01_FULL_38_20]
MNIQKVVGELKKLYPGKNIIFNDPDNPTEIICEVEPGNLTPDRSVIIAVLEGSVSHIHGESKETYEVLKGILEINIEGKTHVLQERQKIEIKSGELHNAKGRETWVKVTSTPAWIPENHKL